MTDVPGFDPVPPDQGEPVPALALGREGDEEDGVEAVTPDDAMEYEDEPSIEEDAP